MIDFNMYITMLIEKFRAFKTNIVYAMNKDKKLFIKLYSNNKIYIKKLKSRDDIEKYKKLFNAEKYIIGPADALHKQK